MIDRGGMHRKQMSDFEAVLWNVEKDPVLRSNMGAVMCLDRSPSHDLLEDKVERASHLISKWRLRAVTRSLSVAAPSWEVDPHFDLNYHLSFRNAPGKGTLADVLSVAGPFFLSNFDVARPLWQIVVLENMASGGAAVIVRIHHSVADGMDALTQTAMHLFDSEQPPGSDPVPEPAVPEVGDVSDPVRETTARRERPAVGANSASGVATGGDGRPWERVRTVAAVAEVLGSGRRVFSGSAGPLSSVMTGRSASIRLDTLVLPLTEAKRAAKADDVRLNDFFVAGVLGALRRYHDHLGVAPEALRIVVPMRLRRPERRGAGLHVVGPRFIAPLQIDDPRERMKVVQGLVATLRAEPALRFFDTMFGTVRRLPKPVQRWLFGGPARSSDVIASNVASARAPLYLAGARIRSQYCFGPRVGTAVNFTLNSYVDKIYIGINSDPAAIPYGDSLVDFLAEAFDELLELA